jgi:mannose-6-phosphate isomerase
MTPRKTPIEATDPYVVQKPWGHEEWLAVNYAYVYKRIYVRAGERTSLQYHERKIETNYIVSGDAEVWLEDESGTLQKSRMRTGQHFTVNPKRKHRIAAVSDLVLQEVSSPEVDDVIRVEDDSERGDGRIDSEHQQQS